MGFFQIRKNLEIAVLDEAVLLDALLDPRGEDLADLQELMQLPGVHRLDGLIADLAVGDGDELIHRLDSLLSCWCARA